MNKVDFDKLVQEKIKKLTEGNGMSMNDIQTETAYNWGAMAVAIRTIGRNKGADVRDIFTIMYDEAIEHGGLVEDDFKTARTVKGYMK